MNATHPNLAESMCRGDGVPEAGFEPARRCRHTLVGRMCLPFPLILARPRKRRNCEKRSQCSSLPRRYDTERSEKNRHQLLGGMSGFFANPAHAASDGISQERSRDALNDLSR